MSLISIFIHRPVATSLLAFAIALPGVIAFHYLPIATFPQVDLPVIEINARQPGASPETMASAVAMPLERAMSNIAGINEMSSSSTSDATRVALEFNIDRNPDGAARDVQSAINAAAGLLPTLPTNPTYRKSAPSRILHLALTSDIYSQLQLYDLAFSVLGQRIAQLDGVGAVDVNGSSLRSVRVEVNPNALNQYGISLEQVRTAINGANAHLPKGSIQDESRRWQIEVNDLSSQAIDYQDLVVAWHNDAPVRLKDVAEIKDSTQEARNGGSLRGKPAIIVSVSKQPDANVVETVDAIKALLPRMKPLMPAGVEMEVLVDRSTTVRKTLSDVGLTLMLSIGLVILVTYAFLRNWRSTLIPTITIPVSLLGTLSVIYLCGFSLNNLTLMALIIATSFVVDDAIVVVENTMRHVEKGVSPLQAALKSIREVSFTLISISLALVAVFIPLLLMGGAVGRTFREFSVTLSIAVALSLFISLTVTPMLCSRLLRRHAPSEKQHRLSAWMDILLEAPVKGYARSLNWVLRHGLLMLILLAVIIAINFYLYAIVPKGFFPDQDTGRLTGYFQGDQNISFQSMREKIDKLMKVVGQDPDINAYYEFSGGSKGGAFNTGSMYATLKPRSERNASAQEIVARLRPKLEKEPGIILRLTPEQDSFSMGTRPGAAQYQYTLLADDLDALNTMAPRLLVALSRLPELKDVSSDFQNKGLQTRLVIDREAASHLGVTQKQIDTTLNDAFGQRLVSTIFEPLNQYYVVLTLAAQYAKGPEALEHIYLVTTSGNKIPLSTISHWENTNAPLAVNHQGLFAAATISFNLAQDVALDQGAQAIETAFAQLNPPQSMRGVFAGNANAFQKSMKSQPWLILTALLAVYIVLGMLYESTLHPLTIISTLPSAGVGALLTLLVFGSQFTIIAMIGVILLIGIVMKNAIMMIDAALQIERERGLPPEQAIRLACLQRFRPILMTTSASLLGALPLALGVGDGAELRVPLGLSIVGGLIFSQVLTLYTTPVVYLYLDRLRLFIAKKWHRNQLHPQISST